MRGQSQKPANLGFVRAAGPARRLRGWSWWLSDSECLGAREDFRVWARMCLRAHIYMDMDIDIGIDKRYTYAYAYTYT